LPRSGVGALTTFDETAAHITATCDFNHCSEFEEGALSGAALLLGVNAVCLAIPGRILSSEDLGLARSGRVQFGGIVREVRLDFVPEANPGDYVMVHVGFAISKVDEAEAKRTYELLAEMGALEEDLPPESQ